MLGREGRHGLPERASDDGLVRHAWGLLSRRRTVRAYEDRAVPAGVVKDLLRAAILAPSAHHAQPWRFAVVQAPEARAALARAMAGAWERDMEADGVPAGVRAARTGASTRSLAKTPVLVVASVSMEDMDRYQDPRRREAERIMATQSLAAAIQNLLLMATAMGLGACWQCAPLFCPGEVRRALDLPADWEPQALIAVGYPATLPRPRRRRPMESVVLWR